MTKFLLVYLVPLIPLLVVGLVLKDKQISRNRIVAYGAKLGGPSATYMAFALLALEMSPAAHEAVKFMVQLRGSENHIQKIGDKDTIVQLWSGKDPPVTAELLSKTSRSVFLAFRVPLRWIGQMARIEILSDFSYQPEFTLLGRSADLDIEASNPSNPLKTLPGNSAPHDAEHASSSNATVSLHCSPEMDQDFTNRKTQPGWEHPSGGPTFPWQAG